MIIKRAGLILALDHEGTIKEQAQLINQLRDYIDAVKLGWYQILNHGPTGITELVREEPGYYIMDIKLGDVAHINQYVVRKLSQMKINAVIIHAITGRENLEKTIETAHREGMDTYLLISMTTGGELYDKNLEYNVKMGMELGVTGFVVPATKPWVIRRVREATGPRHQLISPGIGAQGGKPGCAIANGADFEIVGRAITQSQNPREEAARILKQIKNPEC
ncbi:orotidine-5'-phosphate decarboxylase [Vulcanisaeta thermophila]|uniref:orotidine-5'-phosphate decarboxylase n=1 Tax=Vulcanisaeta thermophila TaxID=867917 RepID=UPI000853034D|nr:orotidine-5'-phosphate decarboxylase [Vulcanisaeta thermophila]